MIDATTVEIRRRLPAAIDEVFRWWTDPSLLCQWMSPVGTAEATLDLRIGGALRIVMKGDGRVIEHTGEYLAIDPPHRLVFSWISPFTGSGPSIVTIELSPAGDQRTDLLLRHSSLPEDAGRSHSQGWTSLLDRMAGALSSEVEPHHAG